MPSSRHLPARPARLALLLATLVALVATLATSPAAADSSEQAAVSVVEVDVADAAEAERLVGSGLDVVALEQGRAEVFLHSAQDRAALRETGLRARELTADLAAENRAARAAEAAAEAQQVTSTLPTGRVSYRTLDEINAEVRALARAHRDRAQLIELPETSLLGHEVLGLYISADGRSDSGRPVFLNTGVHHAREWPTAEFTTEFAHEVLAGDDSRIEGLLADADLIVVPVVNPDGFDISRSRIQEQKRKNCRVTHGEIPTVAECTDPDNFSLGVDLNRNYGAFWGGPGASTRVTAGNHHGPAPFSEPEIRNMRWLATNNQVTVSINNHTPDERLLRAPSSSNEPTPADVVAYDALAQELGAALDWPAGPWTEIYYEASGTAEQTGYYGAGTYAFTPEATPGHSGLERFHPPYEYVVDQYTGTDAYEGSSIREAFLIAWEAAADTEEHAVITGTATPGAELTATKSFTLDTSPFSLDPDGTEVVLPVPMTYSSTYKVPADGTVEMHVNPSLRPSQYLSTHVRESWTVSCDTRARGSAEVEVTVGRGEVAEVDLDRCQRGPRVPPAPPQGRIPRDGRG